MLDELEMIEIEADVEIAETGQTFKTPFTTQLEAREYTLQATYSSQKQEKPATIIEGEKTTVDFTFAVTRKGAPSSSDAVEVTVSPATKEPTTLTLASDKTEYKSGEAIQLSGKLVFSKDLAPLEGRAIKIEENRVEIGSANTATDGTYMLNHTAPTVDAPTPHTYTANFGGDI